jgi:hypothetical protein
VRKKFESPKERLTPGGFGGARFQITDLAGQLQASTKAPTDAQRRLIVQITRELTDHIAQLNGIVTSDLPTLQKQLRDAGLEAPSIRTVRPPTP